MLRVIPILLDAIVCYGFDYEIISQSFIKSTKYLFWHFSQHCNLLFVETKDLYIYIYIQSLKREHVAKKKAQYCKCRVK